MIDIKPSPARVPDIDQLIIEAEHSHLRLGVPYLDDALVGLLPNDLCLIGAKTGRGKTQLCLEIAKANAIAKKRVLFIALEAERNEIEMRLLFQIMSGLYYKDVNRNRKLIVNYRNWRLGKLATHLLKYELEAHEIFEHHYKTLSTVYRHQAFSIEHLTHVLEETKHSADIVILDHLHYLDVEIGRDQHQVTSILMKKIRDLNLYFNKPFVVAAHLRKDIEGMLPATEDFMGSSDIGKNATVTVMIAPHAAGYDPKEQIAQTLISIPKSRTGGMGNLCGVLNYSIRHQAYLTKYQLASVLPLSNKLDFIKEEDYPDWATTRNKE